MARKEGKIRTGVKLGCEKEGVKKGESIEKRNLKQRATRNRSYPRCLER